VEDWIERQLNPDSIPESPDLQRRIATLRTLQMTPVELFVEYQLPVRQAAKGDLAGKKAARQQARIIVEQAVAARIIRALEGRRQLQEVMTAR